MLFIRALAILQSGHGENVCMLFKNNKKTIVTYSWVTNPTYFAYLTNGVTVEGKYLSWGSNGLEAAVPSPH